MKIAKNILELIGNTPLVQINKLNDNCVAKIAAKVSGGPFIKSGRLDLE